MRAIFLPLLFCLFSYGEERLVRIYQANIDLRDSAKLAEQRFYYHNGVDSLRIDSTDGLGRIIYFWYHQDGRISHGIRYYQGEIDTRFEFDWISPDSLIFYYDGEQRGSFKVPEGDLDSAKEYIVTDSMGNIQSRVEQKFDERGSLIEITETSYFDGDSSIYQTLCENTYETGRLVYAACTESRGNGFSEKTQYLFYEYQDFQFSPNSVSRVRLRNNRTQTGDQPYRIDGRLVRNRYFTLGW